MSNRRTYDTAVDLETLLSRCGKLVRDLRQVLRETSDAERPVARRPLAPSIKSQEWRLLR